MSKKELKLRRVLDGGGIARLYKAREEADQKKAAKKAAKQAAKHQRAQTGPAKSKTSSKTSRKRQPRGKQKAATSPIDISSDSPSYYEIENESAEDSELPTACPPATPPVLIGLPQAPQTVLVYPVASASS